ncbi:MAG: exodeoxyribonuclease VII small subunit [Candidatus Kerfeldbacteria bacterium]|nr:exodeoxyribonuclease VII small subunit [Candidatus Kerfeldbacteria bacterium]
MPKKKQVTPTATFAQQFEELEQLVQKFETDELDLTEGLKEFERGLKIAQQLKKVLQETENTIQTLKNKYQ